MTMIGDVLQKHVLVQVMWRTIPDPLTRQTSVTEKKELWKSGEINTQARQLEQATLRTHSVPIKKCSRYLDPKIAVLGRTHAVLKVLHRVRLIWGAIWSGTESYCLQVRPQKRCPTRWVPHRRRINLPTPLNIFGGLGIKFIPSFSFKSQRFYFCFGHAELWSRGMLPDPF